MRNWKRFFAIFLALVLVTGLLPPVDATAVTTPKPTGSGVHQPYAEITLLPSDSVGTLSVDTSRYVSQEEAALQIRQQMISRQETISVKIYSSNADYQSAVDDLLEAVFVHTGEPKEGDSLNWQYHGYKGTVATQMIAGVYYYSVEFVFEYFTTAQQEAELDAKVEEVLASMDLEGKTDYQKVKAIYDWLCANVTYDYENLHDHDYLLKHSAYAAMIHKTAVCQGYALAFYRMALELGIDARYIAGMSGSDRHGWNIVELEYLYYNLDPTWDAGSTSYSYFLTSDANFPYHTRDAKFTTAAFYAAYPMGETNYVPSVPPDLGDQIGSAGENAQWALDENGVLTISGSGPMDDYQNSSETPWAHIREYIREVVVEEGVTTVGEYALGGCANLAKVTLPEGMTQIGWMAFIDCGSLRSINIPSTVSYIGAYAFRDCTGLPSITISAGVTYLGWGAFAGCSGLTQIQVEQANSAFADVDGVLYTKDGKMLHSYPAGRTVTAFSVPAGVEKINYHAFDSAVYLQEVTLPKGLLTIEGVAFQNCQALKNVTLPGSITFIGNSAFYYCQNLANIYYWGTAQMWNAVNKQDDWDENTGAYQLHYMGLDQRKGTIRVETVTTTAGRLATVNIYIEDNPGLNYLELSIGYDSSAFVREAANNGVVLDMYGFSQNYVWSQNQDSTTDGRLITLKLRALDTTPLGEYSVTPVVILARNAAGETVEFEVISGVVQVEAQAPEGEGQLEYTLSEDGQSYTVSSIGTWVGQELVIPATYNGLPVTAIGAQAFYGDGDLTSVTLPEGITTIAKRAFYGCTNLRSINIPSTVTKIGEYAFRRCTSLTGITISSGVTAIGWGAFLECSSLTAITVAAGNLYYRSADGVLYSYVGETLVAYPAGKTNTSFAVPAGVQVLGIHSFDSCNRLLEIILPDGLEKIGNAALQCCENLTSVTIPATLTSIGDASFNGCQNLAYIYYAGTPEMWDQIEKKSGWDNETGAYQVIYPTQSRGSITIGTATAAPGETVALTISLANNPGLAYLELALSYDHSALMLLSVTNGTVLESLAGGDILVWSAAQDSQTNGTLVTLQFQVSQTAAAGDYAVDAAVNAARNAANETVPFDVTAGLLQVEQISSGFSEGLKYTLNEEGTAYIVSGIGECTDVDLVIPASYNGLPVTTIGQQAFYYCKTLRSVTLPEGLTTIEFGAFGLCSNLQSIQLPTTLKTIGYNVFSGCKALAAVTIPVGVTELGGGAFSGCAALTAIAVAEGNACYKAIDGVVYTIDGKTLMAYPSGSADASFTVPAGVETLFDYSFENADNLTEVILSDGLKTICGVAFQGCGQLAAITIPTSVTYIGSSAFSSCYELKDIYYLGTQEMWDAITKPDTWDYQTGDYTLHVQEAVEHCHTAKVITAPTAGTEGSLQLSCAVPDCEHNGNVTLPALNMVDYAFAVVTAPADGNPGTGRFTWRVTDYGEFSFDVTFRYGDVDGNGAVNGKDIILLRRYMANLDYDTGLSTIAVCAGADADGNGQITGQDLILLRRYIANYDYDTGISTVPLGSQ